MRVYIGKVRITSPEKKNRRRFIGAEFISASILVLMFSFRLILYRYYNKGFEGIGAVQLVGPSLAIYFVMRAFIVTRVIIKMVMVWFRGVKDYVLSVSSAVAAGRKAEIVAIKIIPLRSLAKRVVESLTLPNFSWNFKFINSIMISHDKDHLFLIKTKKNDYKKLGDIVSF